MVQSLYVHLPFCRHRCGYCHFSVVAGRDYLIEPYLDAVLSELQLKADERWQLETLYFGGGTPSHLTRHQLTRLLDGLRERIDWSGSTEVTLESNPLDVTDELLRACDDLGINRLSVGVQSFSDAKLQALDRDHRRIDVETAMRVLERRPLAFSIDLIFGTAGESVDSWIDDLRASAQCGAGHWSTYGLTVEKGTPFWNRRWHGETIEAGEDCFADLYEATLDFAEARKWEHYEVSNFASAGQRCRHNLRYWDGSDFEAIGSGAASYRDGIRRLNHASPVTYLRRVASGQSPVCEEDRLSPRDRARELLAVGLRRGEGVQRGRFRALTGWAPEQLASVAIDQLIDAGLLERIGDSLRITRHGWPLSDSISAAIVQTTDVDRPIETSGSFD